MRSRTIAIVGSIAALMFAAAPVTAIAATHSNHRPATESRLDRSRDASGTDRSSGDVSGTDQSGGDVSGIDHSASSADSSLDG